MGRVSKGGQHQDRGPPFETHRCVVLLRVRLFLNRGSER